MSKLQVVISREAQEDFGSISAFIAKDSPSRAERITNELVEQCRRLGRYPGMGRQRWDIDPALRTVSHKNYVIVYEIVDDRVGIVRVVYGTRDLAALLENR